MPELLYCGRCEEEVPPGDWVALPSPGLHAVPLCAPCYTACVWIDVLNSAYALSPDA